MKHPNVVPMITSASCWFLLWGHTRTTLAWVPSPPSFHQQHRSRVSSATNQLLKMSNEPKSNSLSFFEDDECWDLCGLGDEMVAADSTLSSSQQQYSPQQEEQYEEEDDEWDDYSEWEDDDTEDDDVYTSRLRLEMNWNRDECDLNRIESCGELCKECHGHGRVTCRFCHGTTFMTLLDPNDMPCPICEQSGKEECRQCRGAGLIAPWVKMSKVGSSTTDKQPTTEKKGNK